MLPKTLWEAVHLETTRCALKLAHLEQFSDGYHLQNEAVCDCRRLTRLPELPQR